MMMDPAPNTNHRTSSDTRAASICRSRYTAQWESRDAWEKTEWETREAWEKTQCSWTD